MTSAFTIPMIAILVLLISRLLVHYGAAIISFISRLRPLFIATLQVTISIACVHNLTFPATQIWYTMLSSTKNGVVAENVLRLATAVFTGAGMVLAAVVGVFVIEAAAVGKMPGTLGEVVELRPLSFGYLSCTAGYLAGSIRAVQIKRPTISDIEIKPEKPSTNEGEEDPVEHDSSTTSDPVMLGSEGGESEPDGYSDLGRTDFEGWAQKAE